MALFLFAGYVQMAKKDWGEFTGREGMILEELTGKILHVAFTVSNELGCGFLESVYEKSLLIAGISAF